MKPQYNLFAVNAVGKRFPLKMALFLTAAVMLASLCAAGAYADNAGIANEPLPLQGSGSAVDPFLIGSIEDLYTLREHVNAGASCRGYHFAQTRDLTFPEGENWTPIGHPLEGLSFAGYYDGCGHTLNNIRSRHQFAGFFGLLGGEVRNLGVESGRFEGSTAGSIASHGTKDAKIVNCYNKAEVIGTARAGGLTDNFGGQILFSWSLGDVSGTGETTITAGISSYGSADIRYCYTTAGEPGSRLFSGKLTETSLIGRGEVPERLNGLRSAINWKKVGYTDYGALAELSAADGDLRFAGYASTVDKYLAAMEEKYSFSGLGTGKDPFLIESVEDLRRLRDCVNFGVSYRGYHFAQTRDLTFPEGENWTPIGKPLDSIAFNGVYDGCGHTLNNIRSRHQFAGFFGLLGGEVRNLGVESGRFEGSTVGSIASHGTKDAKIVNCYNKAEVAGTARAGGLTDNFGGQILFSWSLGDVSGTGETTITAGISSYGSAAIRYCHSKVKNPVYNNCFTGELSGSAFSSENLTDEMIQKNYRFLAELDEAVVSAEDIVPMHIEDTQLRFKVGEKLAPSGFSAWPGKGLPILFPAVVLAALIYALAVSGREMAREKEAGINTLESIKKERKLTPEEKTHGRLTWKRFVRVGAFLLILSYLSSQIFGVLRYEYNGVNNIKDYKKIDNDKVDVLFMGASTLEAQIDTAELWKEYGVSSYFGGSGGSQSFDHYYYSLIYGGIHKPKLMVLSIHPELVISEYGRVYLDEIFSSTEYNMYNLPGVGLSKLKAHYVNAAVLPENRLYFLLDFPVHHNRYSQLSQNDFTHETGIGKYRLGNFTLYTDKAQKLDMKNVSEISSICMPEEKNEYYLRKTIEYCIGEDIPLLLINTPVAINRIHSTPRANAVELLAKEMNVDYLDMNRYDSAIGITASDFASDGLHMNIEGARKCAHFLGEYLKANYSFLKDHRGSKGYLEWEKHTAEREDKYLQRLTGVEDYLAELARDERKLIAVPYELPDKPSEKLRQLRDTLNELGAEEWTIPFGETATMALDETDMELQMEYGKCTIRVDGAEQTSLSSSGILLVVYDEVLDEIADVVTFSADNNFALKR